MSLLKNFWIKFKSIQLKIQNKKKEQQVKKFYQHDDKLVEKVTSKKKLPTFKQIFFISKYLSKTEKFVIRILSGIVLIAISCLLINVYWTNSQITPKPGGSYTEGLVGSPKYLNPLFAPAKDIDLDITSLVFSGLMKYTDSGLQPDIIQDYSLSDDQKKYTFTLKENLKWHDGQDLTTDDIVFTFNRITNKKTESPLFYNFKGIIIEKIDERTVKFILNEPFAPFLESLTVGIIPEHVWQTIQPENMRLADLNLKPIGNGPYKFESLIKNKEGVIKSINLKVNNEYHNQIPYIENISFKFFETYEQAVTALNNKNVEGINYLPKDLRERIINNRNLNFNLLNLPQYTAVFFNYSNNPILKDPKIRKILSHAINKEKVVNEILNAEAQIIQSPIFPGSLGYTDDFTQYPFNVEHAKTELEKAGWELSEYIIEDESNDSDNEEETTDTNKTTEEQPDLDETSTVEELDNEEIKEKYPFLVRKLKQRYLEFDLTTINHSENLKIAKELQKEWQQIGAKINLNIVEPDVIQDVISSRNYELLLYGQILGHDPDPYPFWHSSQINYPGLNLTSLNNKQIDNLLEAARKLPNEDDRAAKYTEFQKLLAEEVPAIFIFNPTYTYPQSKKIKGFNALKIINPANRFSQINDWYIKTKRQWVK